MDTYKERFTKLEREILRFLFLNAGKSYNQREIALSLKVSPTAIANSVKLLKKEGLIEAINNKNTKPSAISLNLQNNKVIFAKRVENLRMIYESGLAELLFDKFPEATIVLFGSFSFGEDLHSSDIDIAIVGAAKSETGISKFEKILNKKIIIQFYTSFESIHKNLKESILNGIVLKGSVRL